MHRETPLDFWLTVATVISLFVPIWGVLLAPTKLISIPMYLIVVGGMALLIVIGTLIYAKHRNLVLLNRFLIGYIGGLLGTTVIMLLVMGGVALKLMPNMLYGLGNLALGNGLTDAPSTQAAIAGITYHFLLNGAAWGAAYALIIGKARWWYGVFFGMAVWAAFMVSPVFFVLKFPPKAYEYGAILVLMMLIAHLFYGGIIGYMVYRFAYPEVGIEGSKAIRPIYS